MELISICAWCQPDTSATNTTHGICETHAESMINLYLLRKNLAAPALNTSAANKRAHHEEEETPLQSIARQEAGPYTISERKDGCYLIQMRIQSRTSDYQVGFRQVYDTLWLWYINSVTTFISSQVRISTDFTASPLCGHVIRKPGGHQSYCTKCDSFTCHHASMMATVINNEALADYANARFEAARYR